MPWRCCQCGYTNTLPEEQRLRQNSVGSTHIKHLGHSLHKSLTLDSKRVSTGYQDDKQIIGADGDGSAPSSSMVNRTDTFQYSKPRIFSNLEDICCSSPSCAHIYCDTCEFSVDNGSKQDKSAHCCVIM